MMPRLACHGEVVVPEPRTPGVAVAFGQSREDGGAVVGGVVVRGVIPTAEGGLVPVGRPSYRDSNGNGRNGTQGEARARVHGQGCTAKAVWYQKAP